ncbi:transposase [Micromonospora sp. NPDC047620]|uniref:transposase n=1 Tax=Micromonospora sp. NPDC047620 TaxID=3364251 RepID=UPI00371A7AFC
MPAWRRPCGQGCADFECELVEFNGEAEHAHLLVKFPPKVTLARLVKGRSTGPHLGSVQAAALWQGALNSNRMM